MQIFGDNFLEMSKHVFKEKNGDKLHEMSKSVFRENMKNNFSKSSAELAQRVVKIKVLSFR